MKSPIERTKPTETRWVFVFFGVWLYVILNEIHAEGSGCQQPTANGFRLLVEVFRSLREALESIFSK